MPHQENVVSVARSNEDFRRVLFTGDRSQLVVMTIPPGGEVGDERHDHVEQTLFCLSGNGTAILDGARSPFVPGDAVVVTPGTQHNFLNTGTEPLQDLHDLRARKPHRRACPPHESRRGRRPGGRRVRARRRRVSGMESPTALGEPADYAFRPPDGCPGRSVAADPDLGHMTVFPMLVHATS